jgi:hypothetical protein
MKRDIVSKEIVELFCKQELSRFPMSVSRMVGTIAVSFFILVICFSTSWAGPPFRTDDPEPVDYKHGEFYIATQYAKDKDVTSGTVPHFELNYGIVPNVMLHVITPFVYNKPQGEPMQRGYGDTEVGIKYRFLNDEDAHFMVGTFPLAELSTLGTGHAMFFVPLWLQKSWGPWQSYGGGGFWKNPGEGNKDYWFFGWQVQREISQILILGAELFSQTKATEDGTTRTGFTLGAIVNVTDDHHLLVSSGRDIHGENRFSAYVAYQYTFGPHEEKK